MDGLAWRRSALGGMDWLGSEMSCDKRVVCSIEVALIPLWKITISFIQFYCISVTCYFLSTHKNTSVLPSIFDAIMPSAMVY